jgi:hypothetical protein
MPGGYSVVECANNFENRLIAPETETVSEFRKEKHACRLVIRFSPKTYLCSIDGFLDSHWILAT